MSQNRERNFLNPMKSRQRSYPLRISLQCRQSLLELVLYRLLVNKQLIA